MSQKANDLIAGFPFKQNYITIEGVKLHYVDEGAGPPIVLVHGQPTWSYLYRKMIPPLVAAGYRTIAPDLMGFGLSDKPVEESAYTLQRHVKLFTGLIEQLRLKGLTIVGQDWGGPIGFRYAIEHQDNVRALVIMNTPLTIMKLPLMFGAMFKLMFQSGPLSSFLVRRLDLFRKMFYRVGFHRPLPPDVLEMYRLPHPTPETRAGVAAFPKMLPTNERHPNAGYISEIDRTLRSWDIPILAMFSDHDPGFTLEDGQRIADRVPNGRFTAIRNAGHWLQEDGGQEIAARMVTFLRDEVGLKNTKQVVQLEEPLSLRIDSVLS